MTRIGILIINDQSARGEREDESGPTIQALLPEYYEVVHYKLIPNDARRAQEKLTQWSPHCDVILTCGATGFSPKDIAPEATMEVIDKLVPGISEAIRAARVPKDPRAMLSRAVAGIRDRTLIVNLPGGPAAAREALEVILPALERAVEVLRREVVV